MKNRGNFGFGKMLFVLLSGVLFVVTALGTPYFSMETEEDWSYGLYSTQKGMRTLEPMSPVQWDSYMGQWEQYLKEGEPYDLPPYTEFVTPQLYVYEGGGGAGGYNYPEDAGLVMAWGDSTMPEGEYASAWMLDYGLDPDLSNCTITITVVAPQFDLNGNQINTVSFGMQDVNGNVRSWHWSCGTAASPIPWNVPTTITINTALTGVGAAIPMATGYMNNPMFDITKVQVFIVDENASWVGGATPVPPPGTVNPKPWNYWQNLSVQPNAAGGPIVAGINVEVHQDIQRTDINDFHIEGRIESGLPVGMPGGGNWSSPPTLINHVDDIFPNFSIIITPDTTDPGENWYIIKADWWTNTPIPYCTILHLGLEFDATCHNVIIDVVGWWTSNGLRAAAGTLNAGYVPIPGFRVEDNIPGLPGASAQKLRLQNGDGDGDPEPGEINTEIIELELVGLSPIEVTRMLGEKPFEELRAGGMQENLPWLHVLQNGIPVSPANPVEFPAESFFDVYFELDVEQPVTLNAGDILIARERVSFVNNTGETDYRWVWEIHEAHAAESDLGDAPDSSNSFGAMVMTAYPWGVQADYPSVYLAGSPPHGPLHLAPRAVAHLGQAVTQEWEADIGFDQDPTNNIIPPNNKADLDLADDGLLNLPLKLPHCTYVNFNYLVNIITPNVDLYFNAWADWNRDGDWNDGMVCPDGTVTSEWIVQDQVLSGLPVGINNVTTPQFLPFHPAGTPQALPIWLRITLSEKKWNGGSGSGGSGPAGGYQYGETEDYYFTPQITGAACADFNLDGIVDFLDFSKGVANQWLEACP